MEDLENALFLDQVPKVWSKRAYPSLLGLTSWFADLLLRLRELETWATDFVVSFRRSFGKALNKIALNNFFFLQFNSFLRPFGWLDFLILRVF